MKNNICIFEQFSKIGIGLFFLVIAFGFILSGITVFPFFGFLFAIPVFFISLFFFRAHLNKSCQIE